MKNSYLPVGFCLALLVAYTIAHAQEERPAPQSEPTEAAQPWQHLALQQESAGDQFSDREFAKKINRIGADGWELVDVENFSADGSTTKTVYFFKRPLTK